MKICILALKRLTHNTRVVRQAKALSEKGHSVTVLAIELPSRELMDMTPNVRYIKVELNPWPAKVIMKGGRIANAPKRIYNKWRQRIRGFRNKCIRLNKSTLEFVRFVFYKLIRYLKFILITIRQVTCQAGKFCIKIILSIIRSLMQIILMPFRLFNIENNNLSGLNKESKENKSSINTETNVSVKTDFTGLLRKFLIPYMLHAKIINFSSQAEVILADEEFDFCQAHDSFSLLAAKNLAEKSQARLVYDALEAPDERSGVALSGTPQWLKKWESRRDGKIIRSADIVMSVGPALAEWTAKRYGISSDPVVIRNCSLYRESVSDLQLRKDLRLPDKHIVGLLLGSIYRDQGIEQLIDAIPLLKDHIHIALLGPIAQQNYGHHLKTLIKENGLGSRLHILPVQPQHLVLQYASGADFGIIARQAATLNNRLSLPNKVFELIMSRLPIVAGRLPNIEAIVKEFAIGDIFDETDPEDMARVMNTITDEKTLAELKVAVDKAAQICCWEKESLKYINIFASSGNHEGNDRG